MGAWSALCVGCWFVMSMGSGGPAQHPNLLTKATSAAHANLRGLCRREEELERYCMEAQPNPLLTTKATCVHSIPTCRREEELERYRREAQQHPKLRMNAHFNYSSMAAARSSIQ